MSAPSSPLGAVADPEVEVEVEPDRGVLSRSLERIALAEDRFTEVFYIVFFDARPDARPLFGRHSLSEREEMMRETLRSLVAMQTGESWLEDNLIAMGRSHDEYGVEDDMYDDYCACFVEAARRVLCDDLTEADATVLAVAIAAIARRMRPATRSA